MEDMREIPDSMGKYKFSGDIIREGFKYKSFMDDKTGYKVLVRIRKVRKKKI